MNLALQNVTTVQAESGTRITADLVAVDYGFDMSVSCWADLMTQWDDPGNVADPKHIVKKFLVKEAIQGAEAKYAAKRAMGEQNLAMAQALPDTDETKAARIAAAQAYLDTLTAFKAELDADITPRVDSFYTALKAKHVADEDTERAAVVQAEWDAWTASQVDPSGLEGTMDF